MGLSLIAREEWTVLIRSALLSRKASSRERPRTKADLVWFYDPFSIGPRDPGNGEGVLVEYPNVKAKSVLHGTKTAAFRCISKTPYVSFVTTALAEVQITPLTPGIFRISRANPKDITGISWKRKS